MNDSSVGRTGLGHFWEPAEQLMEALFSHLWLELSPQGKQSGKER